MNPCNPNRRRCLQGMLTSALALTWRSNSLLGAAERETAASLVTGKAPQLVVHNARPVEIETPLELLRAQRLTPKELLFVRNNGVLADSLTLEAPARKEWTVDFSGLVEYPRRLALAQLLGLEQVETEMVLQCSGNGRAYFSRLAPASGSQWRNGALGNVRFGGVPFKTVVQALKLTIDPRAKYLTAEGKDTAVSPEHADFEHSIPLAEALEKSMLALRLNGEPLPAIHGGPVRLVTPGYYGTMNVKWLDRVRLEANETYNHHQVRRYRTPRQPVEPGSKFVSTLENSEPNWGMRIKSVFFAPLEGATIPAGPAEVRGVAWNDGLCKIEAVDLSHDGGKSWQRTQLEAPASPYAWYHWKTTVTLPRGEHALWCRAVDALGRTQPLNGASQWNPAGYAWNGVHTIKVTVS